jgi:hypothetical protein
MKSLLTSIMVLLCTQLATAQSCYCPPIAKNDNGGSPYRTFTFANGQKLGVCGNLYIQNTDTTYTSMTLFNCADGKTAKDWGGATNCTVNKIKDTLYVKEMHSLSIGTNFSTLWVPFYVRKYFFKNGELEEKNAYRKDLRKYSKAEIAQVITEYNSLSKESGQTIMKVANMLFWAYVCGSKEAEPLLKSIPEKFGPFEGALEGEWGVIFETYDHWKFLNELK